MITFGKIFSSMSGAFEFNHATLSGSVDIIVIEQPDGSLRSTPFHVRFGKLKVLKSKDKRVLLRVNGYDAGFSMKLGEAGEGFFEEEIQKPVDENKFLNRMEEEATKYVQRRKELKGEPLIIPVTETTSQRGGEQNYEKTRPLNLDAKHPNNSLAKHLQMKHTLSNERTSAESKTSDSEDVVANAYDPYLEIEGSANTKENQSDCYKILDLNGERSRTTTCQSSSNKVKKIKVKTLRPSSDKLKSLNLRQGVNTITYTVESGLQGSQTVSGHIYLWPSDVNLIISDIDGTITKTDFLGHILPMFGKDWSQPGIAPLYTNIRRNGYQILYLTARPIGQALQTKEFLHSVYQDGSMLPHGPLIMSPDRMLPSVKRELLFKRPELFKMAVLKDIRSLFPAHHNPFHAGFGNRETDAVAYKSVGIPLQKVFLVNPRGDIHHHDTAVKSYALINTMVKEIFPGVMKDNLLTAHVTLGPENLLKIDDQRAMEESVAKVIS